MSNPQTQMLEQTKARLSGFLQPWHASLADPAKAQEAVLDCLLKDYAKTKYGVQHSAGQIGSLADYRKAFPVVSYPEIKPVLDQVMAGDLEQLLWEEPVGWAITRGTTRGESKFIPMTPTDLKMRASAGRAVINYAATSGRFDIFEGVNLNLNFPSVLGKVKNGEREYEYGYSSGIYTRHVSTATPVRSVPTQEEIDALGGGKSVKDWERRFDLAYEKCQGQNVTLLGGVVVTALRFGRYLKHTRKVFPKDLWKPLVMTLGSAPGINTHFAVSLKALYGPAAIREIYGTTEGMFGQQRDEKRAWSPNYDLFFFEVQTSNGIKMLHEMRPGEMGSLVVSTPILPRYRIGDMIRAFTPPYFRCIGREGDAAILRYAYNELMSLNFGRL